MGFKLLYAIALFFPLTLFAAGQSTQTIKQPLSIIGNLTFPDNTYDIGASGATRPRTGYFGTSVIAPAFTGALTGAASSNVLKAGDTMTGNLLFSTDNTRDIGANAATRPRTGYFGTSVVSPSFVGALTGAASSNVLKAGDSMTGPLSITSTTFPQATIAYDVSDKLTVGVDSGGGTTFTGAGSFPYFDFAGGDLIVENNLNVYLDSILYGTLQTSGHSAFGANATVDNGDPTYPIVMNVIETITDPTISGFTGVNYITTQNPSADSNYYATGVNVENSIANGNSHTFTGGLTGMNLSVSHNGTGSVAGMTGMNFSMSTNNGDVAGSIIGMSSSIYQGGTGQFGGYIGFNNSVYLTNSVPYASVYGIYLGSTNHPEYLDRNVGIHIDDMAGANESWSIWSGGGNSYHKDHFLINTTTDVASAGLVIKNDHIASNQTTAPTATVNANAGTGGSCSVSNATDTAGNISLTTTATAPASGAQCSIAFNVAYNVAPICVVSPSSTNAAKFAVANGTYFTTSTSALVINYSSADAAGHANSWSYHCVETQ